MIAEQNKAFQESLHTDREKVGGDTAFSYRLMM